jgi:hypothetical protein
MRRDELIRSVDADERRRARRSDEDAHGIRTLGRSFERPLQ